MSAPIPSSSGPFVSLGSLQLGFISDGAALSEAQRAEITRLLSAAAQAAQGRLRIHHGQSGEAEAEISILAATLGAASVAHSETHGRIRRNRDIVEAISPDITQVRATAEHTALIAALSPEPEQSTDTWRGIHHARALGVPLRLVWPDGTITLT